MPKGQVKIPRLPEGHKWGGPPGWEDTNVKLLAKRMGMRQAVISSRLTATTDPGLKFMEEIGRQLGLSVSIVLLRILDAREAKKRRGEIYKFKRENPTTAWLRMRKRLKKIANEPYFRDEVGDY